MLRHVRFHSIYGHRGYTEFLMLCKVCDISRLRIEAKEQRVGGSKDEALVYVYANALEAMPEDNFMLIYEGSGFKAGAIKWWKNAVNIKLWATDENKHKNIQIKSFREFTDWMTDLNL